MAFVYRAERKLDLTKPATNLGPGSYDTELHEQAPIPKAYVPFNSMEPRIRPSKVKETTPGPGAYNIAKRSDQEKVVVQNATEDIKILEITKPNAMFKSGTKRFAEVANTGPGPGYQKQEKSKSVRKSQNRESQKPKIIEHLIKINKYQSIPSIPSNAHAFGYYQNQQNQLELNEPPVQVTTGKKNDMVGPGQYNIAQQQRPKGYSWKEDKTAKLPSFQVNSNVGPGSYDLRDGIPLYNYKPSVAFVSNTLRSSEPRKPAPQNKFSYTDRAKLTSESRVMSQKAPESTHMDSSDDEYEYIQDATPGPGSYINLDTSGIRPRKPAKSTHFGSTSKRFNDLPAIKQHIVGPGQYNINIEKRAVSYQRKKAAPFNSNIQRFIRQEPTKGIPGPGSYQPRNALEDELIFKIQRGYRGQFGSTQQRFKQDRQILQVGPGTYDVPASGVVQPQIQTSGTAPFKSKVIKQTILKNQNPPPGSYNVDCFDIAKKVIKEEDDDPDLIIKKPGFNVGAERFRREIVKEDMFEDQEFLNEIHSKMQEQEKRNKTSMAPFNSSQPRLVERKKQIPGPGEYDINTEEWNKRTYNILFADI